MKSKIIYSIYCVFFFLGMMPLLPFHYKPIGLIIALIVGIAIVFYKKTISSSYFFFNNILLFILYVISTFYSKDKLYSIKYLETSLPLLLFPIFYLFISKLSLSKKFWEKIEHIFYKTYIVSSAIYSIMIFIYIYHLGYFSGKVIYDLCISWIRAYFWGFQNHPIYISLFLGIAILFIIKLTIKSKNNKIWYLLSGLIIMAALLFLSRKGVLFALIPTSVFLFFKTNNSIKIRNYFISVSIVSLLTLVFVFPSSFNRFKEITTINTNNKLNIKNSTSIRIAIYDCVFSQVKDAGFFGFGIGDVKDKLNNCYKNNSKELVNQHLNTHNTYLNIWLSLGFIGLLIFIYILFRLLLLAILKKDFLFLNVLIFFMITFLFENILDRQNGVILFASLINFYSYKNTVIKSKT